MRALVTGGAGFIGSNLVDLLIEEGHEVVVLDNLTTGRRQNLRPDAPLWEMSVSDPSLAQRLRKHPVDIVFHHAAQIDVRRSVTDPRYDASVNILDGITFLQSLAEAGVKNLVYASTGGAIYGEPGIDKLPCDENTKVAPLSGYGVSKYTFEHYLRLFGDLHGFRSCVLRYANVFGPRQDPMGEAGVVAIFVNKLLAGESPLIYGSGEQTRDYVFVKDVARANLLAARKLDGETYNIGTGVETSVLELLDCLVDVMRPEARPATRFEPARQGEVFRIALSAAKAERELGWTPAHTLREGLVLTADSQRVGVLGK